MVLPGTIFFLFSWYSRGFISRCHRPGICSPSSGAQMPSKVPRSSVTECSIAGTRGRWGGFHGGDSQKGWCTKGRNDENLDDFLGVLPFGITFILGWGCRMQDSAGIGQTSQEKCEKWQPLDRILGFSAMAMWVKQIHENHPPVITIR